MSKKESLFYSEGNSNNNEKNKIQEKETIINYPKELKPQKNSIKKVNLSLIRNNINKKLNFNYSKKEYFKNYVDFSEESEYMNLYSRYFRDEFNSRIIVLIINFIKISKTCKIDNKIELNFYKKMIELCKNLLMNEFDIVIFSLLIEQFGWSFENYDLWMYLCFLALYAKQMTLMNILGY